jgi:hypothetical protein
MVAFNRNLWPQSPESAVLTAQPGKSSGKANSELDKTWGQGHGGSCPSLTGRLPVSDRAILAIFAVQLRIKELQNRSFPIHF